MKRLPEREEDVQAAIIQRLELEGYIVLQTSHRTKRVTCPHCLHPFRPTGGYGASFGVPDLLVTHERWRGCVWVGIEVKGIGKDGRPGALRPDQRGLLERGRIIVATSQDEALKCVQEVGEQLWLTG